MHFVKYTLIDYIRLSNNTIWLKISVVVKYCDHIRSAVLVKNQDVQKKSEKPRHCDKLERSPLFGLHRLVWFHSISACEPPCLLDTISYSLLFINIHATPTKFIIKAKPIASWGRDNHGSTVLVPLLKSPNIVPFWQLECRGWYEIQSGRGKKACSFWSMTKYRSKNQCCFAGKPNTDLISMNWTQNIRRTKFLIHSLRSVLSICSGGVRLKYLWIKK